MRKVLALSAALLAAAAAATAQAQETTQAIPVVKVWKSPTCGCCTKWVDHLRAAGFRVEATNVNDMQMIKKLAGIPRQMESCHTAIIDGYRIEGHVPAADIRRLLKERPEIAGLAVPGMVAGSPGMEMPDGSREPYRVLTFGKGQPRVFSSYR